METLLDRYERLDKTILTNELAARISSIYNIYLHTAERIVVEITDYARIPEVALGSSLLYVIMMKQSHMAYFGTEAAQFFAHISFAALEELKYNFKTGDPFFDREFDNSFTQIQRRLENRHGRPHRQLTMVLNCQTQCNTQLKTSLQQLLGYLSNIPSVRRINEPINNHLDHTWGFSHDEVPLAAEKPHDVIGNQFGQQEQITNSKTKRRRGLFRGPLY